MAAEIITFILGIILVVGGWTYFFNFDEDDGNNLWTWNFTALLYVIFLLMGKNREIYRAFVIIWGITMMILPFFF